MATVLNTQLRRLILPLAVVVLLATPALAQSDRDVVNRLNRLENDISTLSRAIYRGEDPPPSLINQGSTTQANAEVRLQQLESEIRTLTGKVEELSYQNTQIQKNIDRLTNDVMLRIQNVEQGRVSGSATAYDGRVSASVEPESGSIPASSAPSYNWQSGTAKQATLKSPVAPPNTLGTIKKDQQTGNVTGASDAAAAKYEHAFALLRNEQYGPAQKSFSSFLEQNPDHVLASNAKYWLGETYYVQGQYDQAARVFAEGYQKYPKGTKAPDNLLKLGLSLASLGSTNDACLALNQLQREFPNGAGPVLIRAKQEKLRLGCS